MMSNNRREQEESTLASGTTTMVKEVVCPRRLDIRTTTETMATAITTRDGSRGAVLHKEEPGGGLAQPKNHLTKTAAPDMIMRQQQQQQQQQQLAPPPASKVVDYVTKTDQDVLLGRGGGSNGHPGNQLYLQEVKRFIADYESAPKRSKLNISQQVVDWIAQRHGGRFIKKEKKTGRWYIVPNEDARNKASQALREACKQRKKEADSKFWDLISSQGDIFDDDGTILKGIDLTSDKRLTGSQVQEQSSSSDETDEAAQAMDML